jgi:hypothetical protein
MSRADSRPRAARSISAAHLMKEAKGPAIAVGTAVAGLAGGVLIGRGSGARGAWRRRTGIGEVARQLRRAGKSAGELAVEVRRLREQASEPQRQSPIEVVLSGLTSRRLPRG